MDISDRIKKLGKYFSQMQIVPNGDTKVVYVIVKFPREWQIDNEIAKKHDVTIAEGDQIGEYYFATDIDTGADAIFDAIDENIDKMKEAIERAQILSKTVSRLRELFEDESIPIEKLRTIDFSFSEDIKDEIIVPKAKNKDKGNE